MAKVAVSFNLEEWQVRRIDEIARVAGINRTGVITSALYKAHAALIPAADKGSRWAKIQKKGGKNS
jgi:hypothetical protein